MSKLTAADLIEWTDEQLEEAGIDKVRLIKVIRHLKSASDLMWGTGLNVYGESGSGYIVHFSRPSHVPESGTGRREKADQGSIIASIGLGFDGGGW